MAANVLIIGGHHVLALQSPPEGWQATSLLERCREHACRRRAHGAAARAVSGRDQRFAGIGLAAVDRGFGGWRGAAADTVAVSGRPLRGAADGCFGRRRQTVAIVSASATAVGRVLAGADAVARVAARSVLVEAAGSEPQRDALGIRCCSCWSPIVCWRRAANGACIVSGFSAARWPICWARMPGWRKSTSFTAVTTGC